MERRKFFARLASLVGLSFVATKAIAQSPVFPAIGDEPIGTVKAFMGNEIPHGWKLLPDDRSFRHDHTHYLCCSEPFAHSHSIAPPSIPLEFIVRV